MKTSQNKPAEAEYLNALKLAKPFVTNSGGNKFIECIGIDRIVPKHYQAPDGFIAKRSETPCN